MISVVVFTTGDACMQCRLTTQLMDALGLVHREVDLAVPSNEASRDYVTSVLGYSAAPVVVAGDDHWSGFRPDRIRDVIARHDSPSSAEER